MEYIGITIVCVLFLSLLFLSVLINYRFYNLYVRVPDNEAVYYKDINYKAGDIILFRALSSIYMWFSGFEYSHAGIILEIDGGLFVLELQPPDVKLTPLFYRLLMVKDGYVFIKPIVKNHGVPDIIKYNTRHLLNWSSNIKYPDTNAKVVLSRIKSCTGRMWDMDDNKDTECAKFLLTALRELGILNGDENVSCDIHKWLGNLTDCNHGYSYESPKLLTFYDEDALVDRTGFWNIPKKYILKGVDQVD